MQWKFSHKKEQNNAIYSNMDATVDYHIFFNPDPPSLDYHTKWSQKEKTYDIIYMWNPKYGINEPVYETETESRQRKN